MTARAHADISVVLVDDHAVLRESLSHYLSTTDDVHVVAEGMSAEEAVELTQEHRPDVLLIDVALQGKSGIEAVEQVTQDLPDTKCICLTMHSEPPFLEAALKAGARGYLTKDTATDELVEAIRDVARGGTRINTSVRESDHIQPRSEKVADLSRRETQVLILVTRRATPARKSPSRLEISTTTVDTYRTRIVEKLGLRHRAELVQFALDHGLLRSE